MGKKIAAYMRISVDTEKDSHIFAVLQHVFHDPSILHQSKPHTLCLTSRSRRERSGNGQVRPAVRLAAMRRYNIGRPATSNERNHMQREIMTSIPFLSQPSAAAENTEEDLAVAQDLKDTLDAHRNGCVGMAANMIGVPKRIIAFVDEDFGGRIFVMFNPHITAEDGAFDTAEGCLSLQGERRTVRYQRIEVDYMDRKFRERHAAFTGFTAQIIQHEIDHCDGVII